MTTIKERILNKVTITESGCWNFTGATNSKGYGNIYLQTVGGKTKTAMPHRVMYEIYHGPIPEGLHICHRCDNPSCVNPEHLFAATQKENIDDMTAKNRHSGGPKHSKLIRNGWTPELRAKRSKQVKERMRQVHVEKAVKAGVPVDWKFCPSCQQWFPRSNFHKNGARHDGLKPVCKPCAVRQAIELQSKRKVLN